MAKAFCHGINSINEWTAKVVIWLWLPFMFLVVIDVFTRYALNKPWFYLDINVQLMGTLIMLGAGYTLLLEGHVGMDMFVQRFSLKKRAILNLILSPLFFVGVGAMVWKVGFAAYKSCLILERYSSSFEPPIYPYKTVMLIGVALLFLQGLSHFVRDFSIAKSGVKPEWK